MKHSFSKKLSECVCSDLVLNLLLDLCVWCWCPCLDEFYYWTWDTDTVRMLISVNFVIVVSKKLRYSLNKLFLMCQDSNKDSKYYEHICSYAVYKGSLELKDKKAYFINNCLKQVYLKLIFLYTVFQTWYGIALFQF